ncbi:MAG: AraC family transcriptional regulator, partial [Solobacterium sp.]|nr:AraC family transcriptional regulator [Solobacterium sp.]
YAKQTISVFDDSVILNIHIRRDTFGDYFFNVLRRSSILSNFFINSLYTTEAIQGILFHTGDSEEIRDTFLDLYREAKTDDKYSWRILDHLVPVLFAKLLRDYSEKVDLIGPDAKDKLRNQRVSILSYINDHFRTVTLEDIADEFHYSVPHISKLIQTEAGVSFSALVRQVRMNHATALLRNTETPISEIGYMVGYENPESFIRAFKKVYSISPSAYRRKNVPSSK